MDEIEAQSSKSPERRQFLTAAAATVPAVALLIAASTKAAHAQVLYGDFTNGGPPGTLS